MKNYLAILVMAFLVMSVAPMVVVADGDDVGGGITIDVDDPNNAPLIFTDPTDRSWYPNDQTRYIAEEYAIGGELTNLFGDSYYNLATRGNYLFTGETMTYYVAVYDEDGDSDINNVTLIKDNAGVGTCGQINEYAAGFPSDAEINTAFSIPSDISYDSVGGGRTDDLWNFYRCVLIVQSEWDNTSGASIIDVIAKDRSGASVATSWQDNLHMNPELKLSLSGTANFGSVEPGQTVTSNTVYLNNVVGSNPAGAVMDVYIASDDYFTDPSNPSAICGLGNGIPYNAFSYYATKGAMDSGDNDNTWPGLGNSDPNICLANSDEFTELPSYSGEIEDMCRIINHNPVSSFLAQGQSMSITFQLDVPTPCEGSFTSGQFHFVGRVV